MVKKIGLLAGIGLAIAVAAPFGDAQAQRQGDPPQDPNQPRKDRPDQPKPKGGEHAPAPRAVAPGQPKAQQAPVPPQTRQAPPADQQRRNFDSRRDGGPGRPFQGQQPPVNVQRPAQGSDTLPDQRRTAPPPPPQADTNTNNRFRRDRQVIPQQPQPQTPAVPGQSGAPAAVKLAPVQPVAPPPAAARTFGGPANSQLRSGGGAPPAAAVLPAAPPTTRVGAPQGFQPGFRPAGPPVTKLEDVQKGRTQRVEAGGRRTIIQEADNRVIIRQNNTTIIRHDETQRFAKNATAVRSTRRGDGTTQTVVVRPGGVQLFNIVDTNGRLVRRYRRDERGREINFIDNRRFYRNAAFIGAGLIAGAVILNLSAPEVRIPRDRYIVDYDRASDDDLYEALSSPPVDRLERAYSLEEIRYNVQLRDRMRRLDLDAVTFPSGSWEVGNEQFPKLERLAKIMLRIINRNPSEVFLIEGHTDAVGAAEDNLTLSDRRAQAVAEILSGVFDIPPENIVTQGYGEQFLKVPTDGAERLNRRVAVRRVTPLLGESEFSDRR